MSQLNSSLAVVVLLRLLERVLNFRFRFLQAAHLQLLTKVILTEAASGDRFYKRLTFSNLHF